MDYNNRFYLFDTEKNNYLYDNYTKEIYNVEKEVSENFKKILEKDIDNFNLSEFPEKSRQDIQNLINAKEKIVPAVREKKCFITINVSNKCNLNCIYCYRKHENKSHLTKENLLEIVEFATTKYMPEAPEYIFSFGFTSEPLLDFQLLKDFDEIIADHEGFLLKHGDFINFSEKKLFEKLPVEIQEKYKSEISDKPGEIEDSYLKILNQILKNESLWNYWQIQKDEYVKSMIAFSNKLFKQKSAMANRILLNEQFQGLIKEPKVKYYTLFFYSNGTLLNQEHIDFIKGMYKTDFWISIDGPEYINNYSRNYANGKSSFNDVIKGIELLQKNNIKVNINTVITPKNINLLEIVDFFKSLKINSMNFQLVRSENLKFSKEILYEYLANFDKLLERVIDGIKNKDYFYINFLKEHFFFDVLQNFYAKGFITKRCGWGEKLSVNAEGELYHCDSTVDLEQKIGTFRDNITYADIEDNKTVDQKEKCKNCFAKNLCGGTCYYYTLLTGKEINEIECIYRKEIIKKVLKFYATLMEMHELKSVMNIITGKQEVNNFINENKKLPVNKKFILEQQKFDKLDGWFSGLSRAIFDSILSLQEKNSILGNCFEIGVWKGKSAIEIAKFLREDESLLLIDPLLDNNKDEIFTNLKDITGKDKSFLQIYSGYSEEFDYYSEAKNYMKKTRFIHIDGCHVGESVYNDLVLAEKLLSKDGVIVVDDFFNIEYPQITEATYKYLSNNEFTLRLFLAGSNKAYLCRPNSYAFYYDFCISMLQKELLVRGFAIKIMKTSPIGDSLTISLKPFDAKEDLPNGFQGFDWAQDKIEYIGYKK
ncbi:radical SAM additional 4Fe4S-binding SPASM domain-containing protein [Treponema bryantii]|uniref:Radical SAM additional 4Fe4S-binding SPASM domain-containing protein n=1 Tax=Treponema bryantii TaxID=163 RepID=A0A1H9H1E7_9SPIR|nr:class I SAM-dependent methyltransferase [Treponema bryantii]SEQ56166.1 radical SAM additional 4Fe4S-binding SPASM domain-containing protein [Treponema bryantii]